jgi:hypothetical protein
MTSKTRPLPSPPVASSGSRADCVPERATGIMGVLCRVVANFLGKLRAPFARRKTGRAPVVHEEVVLSPEGAKVWEEVSNPDSPVGKPVHHRRHRLPDGDLPR